VDAPFLDPAAQGVSGNGFGHGFFNVETSRQAIRFCSRL
tara:strand:+ start:1972 stop:2088 length:117 start_codon:yes stop_codon:yes gene_type:complete